MAVFCKYYQLSPAEVEKIPDELWDAMVRLMQREADQIRAANTKLPR